MKCSLYRLIPWSPQLYKSVVMMSACKRVLFVATYNSIWTACVAVADNLNSLADVVCGVLGVSEYTPKVTMPFWYQIVRLTGNPLSGPIITGGKRALCAIINMIAGRHCPKLLHNKHYLVECECNSPSRNPRRNYSDLILTAIW